jgi:hypothetical protein
MFDLIMVLQRPKHVATLSPNKAVVFSDTAAATNMTHSLPFNSSLVIITHELTTDQFRVVTTD